MVQNGFLQQRFRLTDTSKWADPFLLPSSSFMPRTIETAQDYCLFLYFLNETYRQVSKRIVSHFVTDIEFNSDGPEKEKKWLREYLHDQLKFVDEFNETGEELNCYGNSFVWIYYPFDRRLYEHDNNGFRVEYALSSIPDHDVEFDLQRLQYRITDPKTLHLPKNQRKKKWFRFFDRAMVDPSGIALRRIDPRYVTIWHNDCSGHSRYLWRVKEEQFYSYLVKGDKFYVNTTPLPILKAASAGCDFLFGEGQIFHLKTGTIRGMTTGGWGFPEVLLNLRNIHALQVYRRIDEAVGLDYSLPMRILSPDINSSGSIAQMGNMAEMRRAFSAIVANHRKDPTSMHATAFPIKVAEISGNGKLLTPAENVKIHTEKLLDGAGYPAQLWTGDLTSESTPMALRIFEGTHRPLSGGMNRLLQWVCKSLQDTMNLTRLKVSLTPSKVLEDVERRQVLMQLVSAGEISRKTGLAQMLGIEDPVQERLERTREDMQIEKNNVTEEQKLKQQMLRGSMMDLAAEEAGAAGSAPGGGSLTPMDRMDKAQQQASEWAKMDEGTRRKSMDQLRSTDIELFSLAQQKLKEARAAGAAEGRAAVTA